MSTSNLRNLIAVVGISSTIYLVSRTYQSGNEIESPETSQMSYPPPDYPAVVATQMGVPSTQIAAVPTPEAEIVSSLRNLMLSEDALGLSRMIKEVFPDGISIRSGARETQIWQERALDLFSHLFANNMHAPIIEGYMRITGVSGDCSWIVTSGWDTPAPLTLSGVPAGLTLPTPPVGEYLLDLVELETEDNAFGWKICRNTDSPVGLYLLNWIAGNTERVKSDIYGIVGITLEGDEVSVPFQDLIP